MTAGHEEPTSGPEPIYVGDPMCSWCWGFAPVLGRLVARFELPVHVIVGGLRPGPDARELDGTLRAFLREEWPSIQQTTGQPFDLGFLDRDEFLYDTEPAAIAVVTMRQLAPDSTLAFFGRVQRAFYADGTDVTDPTVYRDLVADFEVDVDEFLELMHSPGAKDQAWQDFARARQLGASSFPTLLARRGAELALVSGGYLRSRPSRSRSRNGSAAAATRPSGLEKPGTP